MSLDVGRDGDWGIQTCREKTYGVQSGHQDGQVSPVSDRGGGRGRGWRERRERREREGGERGRGGTYIPLELTGWWEGGELRGGEGGMKGEERQDTGEYSDEGGGVARERWQR